MANQRILETSRATARDLDYVWSVYRQIVRPLIEPRLPGGWDDSTERGKFIDSFVLDESHILRLDGKPIGWLAGKDDGKTALLEHMYIEEPHRGKGYGGRVFQELLKEWKSAGKKVNVQVLKNTRAREFILRQGFSTTSSVQLTETLELSP
jgi:GNAT superfamily N-acetyltransferase